MDSVWLQITCIGAGEFINRENPASGRLATDLPLNVIPIIELLPPWRIPARGGDSLVWHDQYIRVPREFLYKTLQRYAERSGFSSENVV